MVTSEQLQKSFHYLFPDELPELKRLVSSLESKHPVIVNIGAGSGTSGLAFLEARDDSILITIDIEDRDSPFGSLNSERVVFEDAGLSHLEGVRWSQIKEDSSVVARNFGVLVDMVFIDGDHTYEGCVADIKGWLPLIKPGGLISVHDYRKSDIEPNVDGPHPKPWPGVDRAVDELLLPYFKIVSRVDSLITFRIFDES